ncbi:MAG: DNA ligase D, partial [Gemmatimonadaceae bacterium]
MTTASTSRAKLAEYRRKRDFEKTAEPSGGAAAAARGLRFVIQKHAASHLHFDFRLELDGVMKSWAVPKGPSLDPSVKRLAMEVEDHPIEYNSFEGTIPKGQYGGGTVMLWDRGTYTADDPSSSDPAASLRKGYARGEMKLVLDGERLRGSWVLVRTKRGDAKPQWLLIKHKDKSARPGYDIVVEEVTSVDSARTMDQIATGMGKKRVWQSNRGGSRIADRNSVETVKPSSPAPSKRAVSASALEPMYASVGTEIPSDDGWTFEPKYDGIRVLAFATPTAATLVTRNGKDKSAQFPEVVQALQKLAKQSRRSLVVDGEIVAMADGGPLRFQELQSRMHVKDADEIAGHTASTPAALFAFDLVLDGDDVLLHQPWSERRARLEKLLRNRTTAQLHLTESVPNDGREMLDKARADGWEGVIAKRIDAPYEPGVRSKRWLKLKIEHRQEFVIGGYTEPRNTREHIGALLLGYFDGDRLIYVGHTGGGFTRVGLAEMGKRLTKLERKTSPFTERPKTNERAHFVKPEVVVEVKFNEWTADGKLRQPIFRGVRDDKSARDVGREGESVQPKRAARRRKAGAAAAVKKGGATKTTSRKKESGATIDIVAQLDVIERGPKGSGTITFVDGGTLAVSSLGKTFFPEGHTKGDLMRHYARLAPYMLPVVADRPLVLKRYPNGINGQSFYQQNAPDDVPDGVRVERIKNDAGEQQRRVVGGDLLTMLWTIQLGAVSIDPWHARVQSCDTPDYTVLDLDPGPRAPFTRVVEVALIVRDVLDDLDLHGVPKTSGSRGMHIYVPLPPKTSS